MISNIKNYIEKTNDYKELDSQAKNKKDKILDSIEKNYKTIDKITQQVNNNNFISWFKLSNEDIKDEIKKTSCNYTLSHL